MVAGGKRRWLETVCVPALLLIALTYASGREEGWRLAGGVLGAALSAALVQVASPVVILAVAAASAGLLAFSQTPGAVIGDTILRTQVPGIAMGYLVRRGVSPLLAILGGALPLFLPEASRSLARHGANFIWKDSRAIDELVGAFLESYRKLDVPEKRLVELEAMLREMATLALSIAPALRFVTLLAIFLMIYLLCQSLFARLGFRIRPVERFSLWRLSHWYAWVFALSLMALLLPGERLQVAGRNLLVVMAVAYFVQGLSVTQFHMVRRRIGIAVRLLVYGMGILAMFPFFAAMTTGIGLFDTWFDFRGLEPREPAEGEENRPADE